MVATALLCLYLARFNLLRAVDWAIVTAFKIDYYYLTRQNWEASSMKWMGVPVWKYATDLWIYQEILHEVRPDWIIEAGTYKGGSALYMAHLLDVLGKGRILSFDIVDYQPPPHPRVEYLLLSSTSQEAEQAVEERIKPGDVVMVTLDSDHRAFHVLEELRLYSQYVSPGSYLIVEDTHVNGHPVQPTHGPGPMEALRQFMRENSDFEIDRSREKLKLTANLNGYLRKRLP